MLNSNGVFIPPEVQPQQGLATSITLGGQAVMVIPPGAYGGYIWNPYTETDQGVPIEPLFINPISAPSLEAFGATVAIYQGQNFEVPVAKSVTGIWVNAATTGHRFTVVYWMGP